jgi:hypothetical protein
MLHERKLLNKSRHSEQAFVSSVSIDIILLWTCDAYYTM